MDDGSGAVGGNIQGGIFSLGNNQSNRGGFGDNSAVTNQYPGNPFPGGSSSNSGSPSNSSNPFARRDNGGQRFGNNSNGNNSYSNNSYGNNSYSSPQGVSSAQLQQINVSTLNKISADDLGLDDGPNEDEHAAKPTSSVPATGLSDRRERYKPLGAEPSAVAHVALDADSPFSSISEQAPLGCQPTMAELDRFSLVPERAPA